MTACYAFCGIIFSGIGMILLTAWKIKWEALRSK